MLRLGNNKSSRGLPRENDQRNACSDHGIPG